MHFKEKDRLTENKLFWDFCKRRDGEIITEVVVNLVWWLEWISQWTWNLTEEEERNLFRYDMCVFSHRSIMSNSLLPCGLWPTRVLCPWGFSRQEYWSGLPFPASRDLPRPGIEPVSLLWQVDALSLSHSSLCWTVGLPGGKKLPVSVWDLREQGWIPGKTPWRRKW